MFVYRILNLVNQRVILTLVWCGNYCKYIKYRELSKSVSHVEVVCHRSILLSITNHIYIYIYISLICNAGVENMNNSVVLNDLLAWLESNDEDIILQQYSLRDVISSIDETQSRIINL
jgi:hypothetical protein